VPPRQVTTTVRTLTGTHARYVCRRQPTASPLLREARRGPVRWRRLPWQSRNSPTTSATHLGREGHLATHDTRGHWRDAMDRATIARRLPAMLRKPGLWACCYLGLVPAFGLIYSVLGSAFTQTTALKERGALNRDATRLLGELKRRVVAQRIHGSTVRASDGWTTDLSECDFLSIGQPPEPQILGDGLELHIKCTAARHYNGQRVDAEYIIRAVVSLAIERFSDPDVVAHQVRLQDPLGGTDLAGLKVPRPLAAELFFDLIGSTVIDSADLPTRTVGSLSLPYQLETQFDRFYRSLTGDPNAFSHSFIRMTYFSAETITTLGFGDIMPTTDRSRVLVAIEAMFGVVVAGLFLNSLVGRYLPTIAQRDAG
jgi:hypothetical protein